MAPGDFTNTLAKLIQERGKLLQAFYANAIPLDLLKSEQDRIGIAEQAAKAELDAAEETSRAGRTSSARLSALQATATSRTSRHGRRCARVNDAVLEAVSIRDRKVARTEFSEVFAPLFSRPSSKRR